MDGQCDKGSPVIQVHKWGISPFPFDLSQFREAFISPTRELLVLLSYQYEALLLPLVTGDLINNKPETFGDQCHVNQPLESESAEGFIRSEYKDDAPCTSMSGVNDEACTSKCRFSRYNDYSFLCDVKSLAWGACGSSYNHHKEALFRELLFVSGSNGVVVHAFRETDNVSLSTETVMPMLEGVHGQGNWVTWSPASIQNIAVSGSSGRTVSVVDVNKGIQPTESSTDSSEESEANQFPREDPSKIWLRSFSTTAETVISDGDVWTTFPDKASFPCSASVVSFKILDTDFPIRELSRVYENSNKKSNHIETVLFQETDIAANNSDTVSDSFGDGPFKCFRVFSSSSHNLIGFVLGLVESGLVSDEDEIPANQMKNLVLVARLDGHGIQWVSLVKLMGCVNIEPVAEWVDFCFSDNLLVCLNAAGSVLLFDAMTGDGLANVNIFQACGLDPQSELTCKKKAQVLADGQMKAVDEVGICSLLGVASARRIFKKLLCASYTSMIAAVDEFGIIYVVCIGAHLSENYRDCNQKVPLFQFSGPDVLFGYEVGGFHIGQQRDYTNMVKRNDKVPFSDSAEHVMTQNIQKWKQDCALDDCDLFLNGFSVGLEFPGNKCDSYENSRRMRKVFLSTERFSEEDCFSFSPLGITMLVKKKIGINQRSSRLINLSLQADLNIRDDTYLNPFGKHPIRVEENCAGEAVGCTSQGWLYLVTETGISIVLPTALLSPSPLPAEPLGCLQFDGFTGLKRKLKGITDIIESNQTFPPWKVEVLDRVLLNESHEEADRMCQENGWGLKISRLRRLQLALYYLKYDDIEQSLEMLREVNLAEEGILKLLFAVAYLMLKGNDSDTSAASRLLALASRFTTKVIRSYGFLYCNKGADKSQSIRGTQMLCLPSPFPDEGKYETNDPGKLQEMAYFLEIVRNLQYRISMKSRIASKGLAENGPALNFMDGYLSADERQLSIVSADAQSLDVRNQAEVVNFLCPPNHDKLALVSKEPSSSGTCVKVENGDGVSSIVVPQGIGLGKVENTKEMIARWKLDNLDTTTVVKDALMSGRLPLAVLQLHLYHSRDSNIDQKLPDTFSEVRHLGKSIAYDLFLKGETGLAVATLQKLGEDVESCLKQLLFGTVCKSLRIQIAEEMERYGYLGPYEWKILDRALLIERLYPSTGFWRVFHGRQTTLTQAPEALNSRKVIALHLLRSSPFGSMSIECGEVYGVVLGSWTSINDHSPKAVDDEDFAIAGYWAAAAVWCSAWDQRTIDRIVLDQPFLMGVHILWDSQLEYFLCHNDWEEVHKLIDIIPSSALLDGTLRVSLDEMQNTPDVGPGDELLAYKNYICSIEEVDAVCIDVPDVKLFKFPANFLCSIWLRMLMEQELAKKLIFMKEYWEGMTDIVPLLSRSGFVNSGYCNTSIGDSAVRSIPELNALDPGRPSDATTQALHKLVVYHCVQCDLPNLLDLYLEYHKLVLDNDSLCYLQEAAGDSQWAKWLLFSRLKGREYDASFCNARSILTRSAVSDNNLSVLEVDERIRTVDDIAEGESEMAALATLMHAPEPIQNCLSRGSINRRGSSSAQCTLENLKSALQRFPTLWRTLVAACFVQDASVKYFGASGNNALSDYLNWRANIFLSSTHDTSLLQMLPCWLPKAVRRLIQLYIQGPLGWQSFMGVPSGDNLLNREIDFCVHADENTEITPISWEATIHKLIADELYSPSLKESGAGLEHHLHRGRAFAAFNQILGVRVQKFKSEEPSGSQSHGQTNVQLDVQTLLSPLNDSEEALLSAVTPLAITHFEDSKLVASCAFLLELCGLSSSMLHIDIAALRRISSSYKSDEKHDLLNQFSPRGSAFHLAPHESDIVDSLARSLADEYLHKDCVRDPRFKGRLTTVRSQSPSRALILVLQHLEKASLPSQVDGKTCGSWLSTGDGDGAELRSKQKAASQYWTLVTLFCQTHLLPISTKYLALLANDNDWVGFLAEAQMGGFPFETVVQVAANEFNDSRLRIHILNVLRGMHSRKKACSPSASDSPSDEKQSFFTEQTTLMPAELFRILAECEKNKCPGDVLLKKAKEMSWSVLAMIASCFSDVSSLSCLTVWLEITAARETSSIKVNDLASQVALNVRAAVEATNELPAASRGIAFHCNRRNPKRRRLMEPFSEAFVVPAVDVSSTQHGTTATVPGVVTAEGRNLEVIENITVSCDFDEGPASLSKMVAVLCEQRLFLPLLRAFEMFLPSCSLLPFIRALQAFSQMRLSEASAHLGSFSARIKDESSMSTFSIGREGQVGASWISSTAVKASDAVLLTCPSPYEKRCLLQLLASTDFGDGGSTATCYRRQYMKINLAEPSLRKDNDLHLGDEVLDDSALLTALEKNGHWEQARNWARQLETSGGPWKSAVHHVTETQVESMVAEWKEFLWDVPEERVALWGHCQTLFIRYSFPPLQAGLFFLKHAEAVEKDLPARELLELLLLSLQWLSGMITLHNPVYPMHLLREIETKVWLLAVESEAQIKSDRDFTSATSSRDSAIGNSSNMIDRTASLITKMDNHINAMRNRSMDRYETRDTNFTYQKSHFVDSGSQFVGGNTKTKRRVKGHGPSRRALTDGTDRNTDIEDGSSSFSFKNDFQLQDENIKIDISISKWEESVGPEELERAVLSLLEFGQITASKQLQHKLSPTDSPLEFKLIDAALKLAAIATTYTTVSLELLDDEVQYVVRSNDIPSLQDPLDPMQILEKLATVFTEGSGRGLCKRIIAVVKVANVLGLSFSEAFDKQPIELLRLLSLKAQESFDEASLLVQTHSMPAASIAQILAESFLKGLLAAHRGGYIDSQKEEGPSPLLWRFSDFLKWAELCPSKPEIGHALMRLVITGQEVPHACEVELLILSHHFYKSSACLDGVDVLVALAATRVEAYVAEGDFPCLARLITGVGNFHALNFILGILIENGQLDLLLQKYSTVADTSTGTAEAVRGFRMAVLTSLKHFNHKDLDALAMVYNHFDMKHETAALLESRSWQSSNQWFGRYDKDHNEDLLESMRYFIEAAEVYSSIDAGNKTRRACAQASLVSLQIRMPDSKWLNLSETNARRLLVEQSRFQEALIVAEAYGLNQPTEWALVLWNQMLKPELIEEFVAEFVAVLPLQSTMLIELARFYRAEVAARGDQSQFSVWLTGGGLPAEWAKYLGRSFRCLLKRTRDLRLRLQLATIATGFGEIVDGCTKVLDKVPENAGPLVLRKGHGGAYLPLM